MTDVETVFAGSIAILGIVVGYLLRGRETRQQVRLRPLEDRQNALKEVYSIMVECFYALHEAIGKQPKSDAEHEDAVGKHLVKFEDSLRRNGIWISKVQESVLKARGSFLQTNLALAARRASPQQDPGPEWKKIDFRQLSDSFGEASRAIARQLGIPVLEEDLRKIIGSTVNEDSTSAKREPWSLKRTLKGLFRSIWNRRSASYFGLSILNLVILFSANLLVANPYWIEIDAAVSGIGFVIAVLIISKRREWLKYFVAIIAQVGIILGGIVNGVFQRLTLSVASLLGLDWQVIVLLVVLIVNNALLLSMIDSFRALRYQKPQSEA